jgi:hypothetical protein
LAIWDQLTSALVAVGSIGKKLADWVIGTSQTADVATLITTVGAAGAGLTALATQASMNTVDGIVDAILLDTAEIGAAGAGLTALGDARLANLNAPVGTVDTVVDGIATTLGVAGAGLTALGDARMANLDATVSSRLTPAGTLALVTALSGTERDAIADAHLDRANGIETGVTPRQAHRLEVAAAAGVTSGMATATPLVKNPAGTKTRVTATADADGNRTNIVLTDLT